MRAPAVSFAYKLVAAFLAALLMSALISVDALAGEANVDSAGGEVVASGLSDQSNAFANFSGESQGASVDQDAEDSPVIPMLASGLVGKPSSFINSDVTLDSEPIIGSFTVDGLTYAVIDGPYVELVGVSPDWQQVMNSQEGEGSGVAPMLASGPDGDETDAATLTLPETVSYAGVSHIVSSVGSYAFYLSGVTDVTLPASVSDVDDRAFRSSDVANVAVAEGNQTYSSFDGALYDADQLSLLLIPEGKQGAVLLPKTAEAAEASVFSHCPLVDSISVEKDGAAFASENGLLYTSDLTTLLRVPAGATEITIREGCTTIATGALEACAKLTTINAPTTVISISPDVFHARPTVSLPAASVILSEGAKGPGVEESDESQTSEAAGQLTAMVALSTGDDDLPGMNPQAIKVALPEEANTSSWNTHGFNTLMISPKTSTEVSSADFKSGSSAYIDRPTMVRIYGDGGTFSIRQSQVSSPNNIVAWQSGSWTEYIAAKGRVTVNKTAASFTAADINWNGTWNLSRSGYDFAFWGTSDKAQTGSVNLSIPGGINATYYAIWDIRVSWEPNGGTWENGAEGLKEETRLYGQTANGPASMSAPQKRGYAFRGWSTDPDAAPESASATVDIPNEHVTYYAQWESIDYDLGFDVDSEPDDEDYKGEPKDDQTVNIEDGPTAIEDPKRPGYVFQGWTIPNAEDTEAIDQDLVYQEDDGKWYVDASRLPDYAGDDGRVELTARWTSVISVDVPSSVTFYADVVTQGNESREGLASSAFGQSKVQSQSEVDLRIVGLESKQVKGNGSTSLGASDILKKKDGSDLPATSDKLFSLYPATGELEEGDLKDPDATSASKPAGAVDFSLDDILLEKSFAADEFTIPAGGTLSLGYRLNLQETSTELDYDKLSTLSEGASASIANISYCFAVDGVIKDIEPIYIEYGDRVIGSAEILRAASDIANKGEGSTYYQEYLDIMYAQGVPANGYLPADAEAKIYARYNDAAATAVQPNCDKAGYVRLVLLGVYHDVAELKTGYPDAKGFAGDGTKEPTHGEPYVSKRAGLTFQFMDVLAKAGINGSNVNANGWKGASLRVSMNSSMVDKLAIKDAIKETYRFRHNYGGVETSGLWPSVLDTTQEKMFLISPVEMLGRIDPADDSRYDEGGILAWYNHEGYQYEYYSQVCGLSLKSGPNYASLIKRQGDKGLSTWWYNQPTGAYATSWYYITSNGARTWANASSKFGVVPAFCL